MLQSYTLGVQSVLCPIFKISNQPPHSRSHTWKWNLFIEIKKKEKKKRSLNYAILNVECMIVYIEEVACKIIVPNKIVVIVTASPSNSSFAN